MFESLIKYASESKHKCAGYHLICRMVNGQTYRGAVISHGSNEGRAWVVLETPDGDVRQIAVNERHCFSAEIEW